ncbi:diaminopimelate epimerase [Metabacillus iocasae]|uniref:Diaminopimelate epimerase n=1 Tax=Priestia iocasae TaxID=2291674 RepID=A0ABS2QSE1_9BACI|nr:diaminopimelate epimerase [Metabacillus iocasae]MBM7702366.1 diaminopimelate epimerase [Metabacillus iocasae]
MMQEIDFIKCNPTQNMTILVKTEHSITEHTRIASKMMAYDNVYAEQVGFIERPVTHKAAAHLQMAGGEFCGNACMALAAFLAAEKGLQVHEQTDVVLETSGTDELVACHVKRQGDTYHCQVSMPVPEKVEQRVIQYEGNELSIVIVRYREFIHLVLEVEAFHEEVKAQAESLAKLLGVTLGAQLIGVLLYQVQSKELAPLIYVPSVDSLIWERGCGSGTASIGAYLAWKQEEEVVEKITQPGGTIGVTATWYNGAITSLTIEGSVGIVAQGKAFVNV